jgi:hypothetical protein
MHFWRLTQPDYASDYADTFINGDLEHPFSLPGVHCERCGQTWSGSTILPYELPIQLHALNSLKDHRPISGSEHVNLRSSILKALQAAGAPLTELQVGAIFQPGYLDVPSRPEADFLWSGMGSVVVSQRIRDALVDSAINGCVLVPVVPRRIGKRRATLPPPVPSNGEPEALLAEIGPILDPLKVPPYYELVVTAESRQPPGAELEAVCDLCGRETYDDSARQLVMEPEMWNGDDVFFLRTTLWIIVTDSVKTLLERLRPTNLAFTPM